MIPPPSFRILLGVLLFFVAFPVAAQEKEADEKQKKSPAQLCAEEHENAQVQRLEGELLEARQSLLQCASEACPSFIRNDCVRWLEEVGQETPSVILEAEGDDGPLTDVTVLVNGEELTKGLTGKAIRLNPGTYRFEFVTEEGETRTVRALLHQGERHTVVEADFRSEEVKAAASGGTSVAPPPADQPAGRRPVNAPVYIAGGITVAAAASFGAFGILAKSEESDALDTCAPNCSDGVVDSIQQKALIADISLGVAVGAAATTAVLFLVRPTVQEEPTGAKLRPTFAIGPKGGFLGMKGAF